MKVKLTYIKDTERVSPKTNKPYTSRSIKTQEHGEQWLSGFRNKDNADWKVGDEVEIEIKEVKKDDRVFLNFETPKKEDKVAESLMGIQIKLGGMHNDIRRILERMDGKKEVHYPTPEEEGIDVNAEFPEDDIEEEMSSAPWRS